MLRDCAPAPVLRGDAVLALPYCDSLSVAATTSFAADRAREQVARRCREAGFVFHEEEEASK